MKYYETIEDLCNAKNLSIWQLARMIGCSPKTILKWEEDRASVSCRAKTRIETALETIGKKDEPRPYGRNRTKSGMDGYQWESKMRSKIEEAEQAQIRFATSLLLDILNGEDISYVEFKLNDSDKANLVRIVSKLR